MTNAGATNWSSYIEYNIFSIRAAYHDTLGMSPFSALCGREPQLSIDLALLPPLEIRDSDAKQTLKDCIVKLKKTQSKARRGADKARGRAISKLNKKAESKNLRSEIMRAFTPLPLTQRLKDLLIIGMARMRLLSRSQKVSGLLTERSKAN